MDKLYQRINYENSPSKKTPLNKTNLNKMDKALDDLDNRIIEQDAAFAKSIAAEDKKIADVDSRVSELTETAAALAQSKSDAIVCSKSGTTIIATDSADTGFEGFKTFGWGVQETFSGKNLLKTADLNYTYNGITRTKNADGSVMFNGTATADAFFTECTGFTFKAGEKYILSGCPDGGSNSKYFLYADGVYGIDYGAGADIIRDKDTTTNIVILIKSGVTVSNLVFKPMIRLASITDDTYEPYTGGIASPNPEYPQPIVGAGQMLALGKNLLENTATSKTVNGITFTVNTDKSVTVNGTATADINFDFVSTLPSVSGKYANAIRLSGSYSGTIRHIEYTSSWLGGDYSTLDTARLLHDDLEYTIFRINVLSGTVCDNLKLGYIISTDPNAEWEPYTGGVKAAYDVGIAHKLTGKNLLGISSSKILRIVGVSCEIVNNILALTKTADNSSVHALLNIAGVDELSGHSITMSVDTDDGCQICLGYADSDGENRTLIAASIQKQVTMLVDGTNYKGKRVVAWLYLSSESVVGKTTSFKNIQVEYGTVATEYEPYTEQTLTTNKVLNGIEVTDASLATYTDADGKMWCADYRDWGRGVDVQRIGEKVYNGGIYEGWTLSTPSNYLSNIFYANCMDAMKILAGEAYAFCSHYVYDYGNHHFSIQDKHCMLYNDGNGTYPNQNWLYLRDTDYATADELKAALAANPITVQYILATPIETPIPEDEMIAYKALHSNKPTTVVTNDAWCMMAIEYVADPKNHINQNYVPVSKYTALEERVSALEQLHV